MAVRKPSGKAGQPDRGGPWPTYVTTFCLMAACGYAIGFLTKDMVFSRSLPGTGGLGSAASSSSAAGARSLLTRSKKHKWPGDSIHSVLTSSGIAYQNFQTRIMYQTYKMVQQMPGGERLTGFTRILHRTVPDVLMDEVPTFLSFPHKPECDNWCDYPVANRPYAIKDFFDAAAKNESMIQGAWVFMLECDYVWMQPMKVPGSAYDPSVPGVQFLFDYINPSHPKASKYIAKLMHGFNGSTQEVPRSGPAPVLLRLEDWITLAPDFLQASIEMELDEEMRKALGWVREMYAWDVAVAKHAQRIPVRTEHPPNSTTIVQPPFDEGLLDAAMCHYTWGALYHEGKPSKGGKQVYRWEKRDYRDPKQVLKVPNIPMPPEYKDGWILEFDAPLNRKRHNLVVLMLTQMNKAIDQLPDLSERNERFEKEELKQYEKERDVKLAAIHRKQSIQAAVVATNKQAGSAPKKEAKGSGGAAGTATAAKSSRRMRS